MNSNITNIIRSAVFLACALPLTISLAGRVNVGTEVTRKSLEVTPAEQVLIDLKNDPNELINLFGQPVQREQTRWMTERLLAYGKTHNDEYLSIPRVKSWIDQVLKTN